MKRRAPPTSEEVIAKVKDDGDFDSLRLKIVRKVKENEGLRNTIITEVKQSTILNTDGSEYLKPGQISEAIYEELGSKIMGQISDEVWKVIRSNDSIKSDIRETVESVYNRLVNPRVAKGEQISSSSAKVQMINRNEDNAPPVAVSLCDANVPDDNELEEPPGFVQYNQHSNGEHKELINDAQPCLSSNGELHRRSDAFHLSDAIPPGFGVGGDHPPEVLCGDDDDDDPDVPPGFG